MSQQQTLQLSCLPSELFLDEILSHVFYYHPKGIFNLRLVCKDWNELLVRGVEFWNREMKLFQGMKARQIHKLMMPSSLTVDASFMLNCFRFREYCKDSIEKLEKIEEKYKEMTSLTNFKAILNESNSEIVEEMIEWITPFIFFDKWNLFSAGNSSQSSTCICTELFIVNTGRRAIGNSIKKMKLMFRCYRCDTDSGNQGLLRELSVILKIQEERIVLLENTIFKDSKQTKMVSNKNAIRNVMDFMGLSQEMLQSDECLREFLISIYIQGIVHLLPVAACERDLFEIVH